MKMECEFYLVL